MNTIQKLKQNLQQSLIWGATFKQQIKKMLQQLTTKTSQILQLRRQSIFFNDEINKHQSQLKGLLEEKKRAHYKKDKIQIKLDEITSRMGIYQLSIKKKNQWNKQLRKKLDEIQGKIQEEKREGDWEDIFEDMGQSHLSIKSAVSSQRQSGVRSRGEETASKIDLKLQRLRKLQVQFMLQTSKCKNKQQQFQRLKKIEQRLRQKLKAQDTQSNANKENRSNNSIQTVQQMNKQTKDCMLKLKQLEQKHQVTIKSLEQQRKWINLYAKYIHQIVQSQKSMEVFKDQVTQIDRESKKEKKKMDTIFSYILNQSNE